MRELFSTKTTTAATNGATTRVTYLHSIKRTNNGSNSTNTTASTSLSTRNSSSSSSSLRSKVTHRTAAAPNDASQSNHNSSHRSFQGRKSFRRTLMLRKNAAQNQQQSKNNRSSPKRQLLLRSSFTTSDKDCCFPSNINTLAAIEEREAEDVTPDSSVPSQFYSSLSSNTPQSKLLSRPSSSFAPTTSPDIPLRHIETIFQIYGDDDKASSTGSPLDLYRDVLHVSQDATDREIRIAYFRRGREVLRDAGAVVPTATTTNNYNTLYDDATTTTNTSQTTMSVVSLLDPFTRAKFQALSMAHEILTTPTWKESYLQSGGLRVPTTTIQEQQPLVVKPVAKTLSLNDERKRMGLADSPEHVVGVEETKPFLPAADIPTEVQFAPVQKSCRPMSALRSSTFRRGTRTSLITAGKNDNKSPPRQSCVRWSEHVEELVFENDPNEHASDSEEEDDDDGSMDHDDFIHDFLLLGESGRMFGQQKRAKIFSLQDTTGSPTNESSESTPSSSSSRRKNKKKRRIVIDSEGLESHLNRIDDEAKKHFVRDFFDTFEESMDGILSMVDSLGDVPTKQYSQFKKMKSVARFRAKHLFARIDKNDSHDSSDRSEEDINSLLSTASSPMADNDVPVNHSKSVTQPTVPHGNSLVQDLPETGGALSSSLTSSKVQPAELESTDEALPCPIETPDSSRNPLQRCRQEIEQIVGSPPASLEVQENVAGNILSTDGAIKRKVMPSISWHKAKSPLVAQASGSFQVTSPSSVTESNTFFRPISPNPSEASDILTIRSDEFDLEKLSMSDFDNPFREGSSCISAVDAPPQGAKDTSIVSEQPEHINTSLETDATITTTHVSSANSAKPKRVNISNLGKLSNFNNPIREDSSPISALDALQDAKGAFIPSKESEQINISLGTVDTITTTHVTSATSAKPKRVNISNREKLSMSDFNNPFREDSSRISALDAPQDAKSTFIPSEQSDQINTLLETVDTITTTHVSSAASAKPIRVNISMVSSIRQSKPNTMTLQTVSKQARLRNTSKSSGDDVFAGLDEEVQQDTVSQSNGIVGLKEVPSLALQRNNFMATSDCLSDLTASDTGYHIRTPAKIQNTQHSFRPPNQCSRGVDTSATELSTATTVRSNVTSPSHQIRLPRSGSSLSSKRDPVSSTASAGDGTSIHSIESTVEDNGFFDYFMAYLSAVVKECYALGKAGPVFQNDFLGLFAEEGSVITEKTEPPNSVPSDGSSSLSSACQS